MKNYGIVFVLTFLFTSILQAQDVPPFPSVDKAYKKVLGFEQVYNKLKKDYKIENPRDCKFEKKMTIGGGDIITSDFSSYQTDEALKINYRWPDDRCYTVFTVTTPKSSEGVVYKLPLVVEYSRLKHGVLTNTWEFYWWYFDTPYSTEGGGNDQLFYSLLIEEMKKMKPNLIPYKRHDAVPASLVDLTSIQKIEKDPETPDVREMGYSDQDYIERQYVVHGTATKYKDSDESYVEENYSNAKGYLTVKFARPKDESGSTGDWSVYSIRGTSWQIDKGTPNQDTNLYHSFGSIGFEKIFKKKPVPKVIPYFSDRNEETLDAAMEKILVDLFYEKEGAEEEFKKYIIPESDAIVSSFKKYFADMRSKFVDLEKEDGKVVGVVSSASVDTDPEDCKLYLYINGKRKSYATDKSLKKKYKSAGMSKDVLKRYSASHTDRQKHIFKLKLINGQLKIAEPIQREEPIPF